MGLVCHDRRPGHLDRAVGARLQRPRLRPAGARRDAARRLGPRRAALPAGRRARTSEREHAPAGAAAGGGPTRIAPARAAGPPRCVPLRWSPVCAPPERQAASRSRSRWRRASRGVRRRRRRERQRLLPSSSGAASRALTVYSDLPLAGPTRRAMHSIVHGEQLALHEAGNRVGRCARAARRRSTTPLRSGALGPGPDRPNAQSRVVGPGSDRLHRRLRLRRDGDLAAERPTPAEHPAAQPVEPLRRLHRRAARPTTRATRRATSRAATTRSRGSSRPTTTRPRRRVTLHGRRVGVTRLYVLGDVSDPFDADIAQLIANDAPSRRRRGRRLQARIDTETNTQPQGYAGARDRDRRARADAVVLGGQPGPGALALWSELHTMLPHAKLFAPSTLATPEFLAHLGAAASADLRDEPDPGLVRSTRRRRSGSSASTAAATASTRRRTRSTATTRCATCCWRSARADAAASARRIADRVPRFFHLGERPRRDRRLHDLPGRRHVADDASTAIASSGGRRALRDRLSDARARLRRRAQPGRRRRA